MSLRIPVHIKVIISVMSAVLWFGCNSDSPTAPDEPSTGNYSIAGTVFLDTNVDGTRQGAETWGISGVVIRLTDIDGYARTSTTTGNGLGRFQFAGLTPGSYSLEIDQSTIPPILSLTTEPLVTVDTGTSSYTNPIMAHGNLRPDREPAARLPITKFQPHKYTLPGAARIQLEQSPTGKTGMSSAGEEYTHDFGIGFAPEDKVPFRFLTFGDSITRGQGSFDENGYPTILIPKIQGFFGQGEIINGGVDGSMASEGIEWLEEYLVNHQPSYLLIMYGILDCVNPATWDEFEANHVEQTLFNIVDITRSYGTLPVLSTITPVNPRGRLASVKNRIDYINNLLRAMAPQRNVLLADVNAAMEATGNLAVLIDDWGHPNDAGYQIIAQEWFETVSEGSQYSSTSHPYPYGPQLPEMKTSLDKAGKRMIVKSGAR